MYERMLKSSSSNHHNFHHHFLQDILDAMWTISKKQSSNIIYKFQDHIEPKDLYSYGI